MQRSRSFAQEVDRIVVAPYAVSLKCLLQILKHTSTVDLHIWSSIKACQIRPLVSRVLQSIPTDEHALSVLYSLIRTERVRNDVLLYRPSALEDLFFHSGDVHDDCLSLFNTPIPEAITLPQNAIAFIKQILSNVQGVSTQVWIRRLQKILCSCGPEILDVMDKAIIYHCFSTWSHVLKANQNFEFLCCLDIGCMLQRFPKEINASCSTDSLVDAERIAIQGWIAKANSLLTYKSDRLVRSLLLRALYFVSNQSDTTTDRATAAGVMIKGTLQSIDCVVIRTTMQEEENVEALTKLIYKVNNMKTKSLLLLVMSDIIQILDPVSRLSQSSAHVSIQNIMIITQTPDPFLQRIHYVDAFKCAFKAWIDTNQLQAGILKGQSGHTNYLKDCFEFAIDQCMPGRKASIDNILKLEQVSLLMEAIRQTVISYDDPAFARFISPLTIPEWWSVDFAIPQSPPNCAFLEICPHVFETHRQHATLEITGLIMQISCVYGIPLSQPNYERLRHRISQATNHDSRYICAYVVLKDHKPLDDSPVRQSAVGKYDLSQELAMVNQRTREIVQFHVNATCRDLEDRCYSFEEPLRAVRLEVEKLEKDLAKSVASTRTVTAGHRDECARLHEKIQDLEQGTEAIQQLNEDMKKQQVLDEMKWQAEIEALQNGMMELERTITNLNREGTELNGQLKERYEALQQLRSEGEACASTRDILHLELSEARDKEKKLLSVLFENRSV